MMKKTPAWIAILFVLFLSGCSLSGSRENALFTYAKIESRKSEQLHTYDSPYTLYLKNADDTYTMFVFASPVQFSEGDGRYSLIDPTLVESSREGIAFENKANAVKTSFPDKADGAFRIERGETFLELRFRDGALPAEPAKKAAVSTFAGEPADAAIYEQEGRSMAVYPTRTGFHLEVTWDDAAKAADIPVQITSSDTVQTYGGNGTLVFRKNGQIGAVITHPLLFSPGEETPRWDIAGGIRIEDSSQGCFTFILPEDRAREGPLTALLSFDLYENKLPDTGAVSAYPDTNAYLSPVSLVGSHAQWGTGVQYIRFRLQYFCKLNPEDILSASYHLRVFSGSGLEELGLYKMETNWSSTGLTWNTRLPPGDLAAEARPSGTGELVFDLTDFAKACFADPTWMTESKGLLLKAASPESGYAVCASHDHALYPPYLRIELRDLPEEIYVRDNINEVEPS